MLLCQYRDQLREKSDKTFMEFLGLEMKNSNVGLEDLAMLYSK